MKYAVKTTSEVYGEIRTSFQGMNSKPYHSINKYFVPFTEKEQAEKWISERINSEDWQETEFEIVEL